MDTWQHRPRSNTFAGFKRKYMPSSVQKETKPPGSPILSRKPSTKVRRMFSFNRTLRMPKAPRPSRAAIIFDCLKKGLREQIHRRQNELDDMRSQQQGTLKSVKSRTGYHYDLGKQIKNTERFIRKLDFHLSKIDELQDNYNIQQRIREGAKNIMKAYEDSSSQNYREPVHEAKTGYKDCTQAMCYMEAELESFLGCFQLEVQGIAGFARLCTGDLFEVLLRHGGQKWKFKGRVEKDSEQTWENRTMLLYPVIEDNISIRVTELKGLGRPNVVLGNMECDPTNLYRAEPQTLTVDINEAGTLKLNMKVAWSPFQLEDEPGGSLGTVNEQSLRSKDKPRSSFENLVNKGERTDDSAGNSVDTSMGTQTTNDQMLYIAFQNLHSTIDDFKGAYAQVDKLEEVMQKIKEYCLRRISQNHDGSQEKEVTVSVENALKSFDFLNTLEDESVLNKTSGLRIEDMAASDDLGSTRNKMEEKCEKMNGLENEECSMDTEENHEKTDAGIGMDDDSVLKFTTGNEALDVLFTQHLQHCQFLLSMLGSFGPLRSKEMTILRNLESQTKIFTKLLQLDPTNNFTSAVEVVPELQDKPGFVSFWTKCCVASVLLYSSVENIVLQLELEFGAKLRTSHPSFADNIFHLIVKTMLDRSPADIHYCNYKVTLYQFAEWCMASHKADMEQYISDLINELTMNECLQSSNEDILKDLKRLPKVPLPASSLLCLAMLLVEGDATTKAGVSIYMEMMATDNNWKRQAKKVFLGCLEDSSQAVRQAGCLALASVNATSCIEQLVYLCRCDVDDVKVTAKDALMSLGHTIDTKG
ncbi:rho family-interacting cell polarization regulator 2-like isoform X2 [Ptychodera flava]|uniref:rho family-interacting cell polarization regulator 2-like isoform X2 n=1 Tax=Ptychodera flava TaxID=63121 RepID=UPI00396A6F1E